MNRENIAEKKICSMQGHEMELHSFAVEIRESLAAHLLLHYLLNILKNIGSIDFRLSLGNN